jgi:hypothetical protein
MFAFVLSSTHIDVPVSAAIEFGLTKAFGEEADELGRMLRRENVRSVVHRYRLTDMPEEAAYEADIATYRFRRYPGIRPVAAANAAHCYAYQSCEHPEWEGSQARRVTDALRDAILRGMTGYDAVPWGFDQPEQARAWTGLQGGRVP